MSIFSVAIPNIFYKKNLFTLMSVCFLIPSCDGMHLLCPCALKAMTQPWNVLCGSLHPGVLFSVLVNAMKTSWQWDPFPLMANTMSVPGWKTLLAHFLCNGENAKSNITWQSEHCQLSMSLCPGSSGSSLVIICPR